MTKVLIRNTNFTKKPKMLQSGMWLLLFLLGFLHVSAATQSTVFDTDAIRETTCALVSSCKIKDNCRAPKETSSGDDPIGYTPCVYETIYTQKAQIDQGEKTIKLSLQRASVKLEEFLEICANNSMTWSETPLPFARITYNENARATQTLTLYSQAKNLDQSPIYIIFGKASGGGIPPFFTTKTFPRPARISPSTGFLFSSEATLTPRNSTCAGTLSEAALNPCNSTCAGTLNVKLPLLNNSFFTIVATSTQSSSQAVPHNSSNIRKIRFFLGDAEDSFEFPALCGLGWLDKPNAPESNAVSVLVDRTDHLTGVTAKTLDTFTCHEQNLQAYITTKENCFIQHIFANKAVAWAAPKQILATCIYRVTQPKDLACLLRVTALPTTSPEGERTIACINSITGEPLDLITLKPEKDFPAQALMKTTTNTHAMVNTLGNNTTSCTCMIKISPTHTITISAQEEKLSLMLDEKTRCTVTYDHKTNSIQHTTLP